MLERLNQNAENLRTLHQALSDPKIKKATVSDPQYDEIKQETLNLMNMANHFVDSGVAPTREELQQYDELLMKLDAKSARYLKEREANDDAELQKRIHAISAPSKDYHISTAYCLWAKPGIVQRITGFQKVYDATKKERDANDARIRSLTKALQHPDGRDDF